MKNILDQISSHYPKLKPSQKKVASCLHNNINEAFLLKLISDRKESRCVTYCKHKDSNIHRILCCSNEPDKCLDYINSLKEKIRLYLPLINLKTPLRNSRRIFREQFLDTKRKEVRSLIFSFQRIT